jgi:hypothetical protein
MNNVRQDIRQAFGLEQEALGDLAGTRQKLMRNALAQRDSSSKRLSWAAGTAAALLAVMVIATFAYIRAGSQSRVMPGATPQATATPSPTAAPSPTPLSQQIAVSDSTPLILYHDPATFDQIDGMTWDGKTRGRIGAGAMRGGYANPPGTLYSTSNDIRDRSGKVLITFDPTQGQPFWADDGRSYCSLGRTGARDTTSVGELQVGVPGQPLRSVARIGSFPWAGSNGGGPYVAACSIQGDRAVVVQSGGQGIGTSQFWVVRLSTGQILWSRTPAEATGTGLAQIVASHDGQYIAENRGGDPAPDTIIYGANGSAVGHIGRWINAFSWDGALGVTSPLPGSTGAVSVQSWRDGTVLWSGPTGSGYRYWQASAEPGGTRLAVGILDPQFPQTTGFAPVDLFVIAGDGHVVFEQQNNYLFIW